MSILRNLTRVNYEVTAKTLSMTLRPLTTSLSLNADPSWLSKLLMVRKIEPGKDSHSRLLSDSDLVYLMQIHDVKPGSMSSYLKTCVNYVEEMKKHETCELVASWKVDIGDEDQIVHIWRFKEGFANTSRIQRELKNDDKIVKLVDEQSKYLRQRNNQLMMAFSYWGHPQPQVTDCMFEMRSYVLKPGTMIEWGNNWSRGINYRSNKVAGFFSQIGQLYTVHHIFRYENLQSRKDVREDAWRKPGWDEVVAYTVPLIREMRSRWMTGLDFSPIR